MKLISCTDFVLEQGNPSNTDSQFADKVMAYANFLKQPLTLGMFVPCDLDGNVLENKELSECNKKCPLKNDYKTCCEHKYIYEAKERVLFSGFEVKREFWLDGSYVDYIRLGDDREDKLFRSNDGKGWYLSHPYDYETIEQIIEYELTLTDSAKKQIGL